MPYSAEISRRNPTCFVSLIDQSGSMDDPFGNDPNIRKADGVADAINRLLDTLVDRATKGVEVLDRYYVGIIGYGAQVRFAFGGALQVGDLIPISQIASSPLRIEVRDKMIPDGAGGLTTCQMKFPIWFEPKAEGPTPMAEALELAYQALQSFVATHPKAYPPIVMNLTDGQPTDKEGRMTDAVLADVEDAARRLRQLATEDGQVLLFNLHISETSGRPILYPNSDARLPDEYARMLFRMSSVLPSPMIAAGQRQFPHLGLTEGARGFVYQADLVSVIQFLDIGTRATQPIPQR